MMVHQSFNDGFRDGFLGIIKLAMTGVGTKMPQGMKPNNPIEDRISKSEWEGVGPSGAQAAQMRKEISAQGKMTSFGAAKDMLLSPGKSLAKNVMNTANSIANFSPRQYVQDTVRGAAQPVIQDAEEAIERQRTAFTKDIDDRMAKIEGYLSPFKNLGSSLSQGWDWMRANPGLAALGGSALLGTGGLLGSFLTGGYQQPPQYGQPQYQYTGDYYNPHALGP